MTAPFLAHAIPNFLRNHTSKNERAHKRRIEQWREGNWFGLHTDRLMEMFEPYFNPLALSQLLSHYLGNNLQMIVLEYATCDNELQPQIGVIFQDERLALWDKLLGRPLAWLLAQLVRELNLNLTVETLKSPADTTIVTFESRESEIQRKQPQLTTSRWTLVVLHNKGDKYYEKLLKTFRSRVVLELPGNKPFALLEPPSHINPKKKVTECKIWVKEVVPLNERVLANLALCFGTATEAETTKGDGENIKK